MSRRGCSRHYRQPGEKPDVRTSFGFSELSPAGALPAERCIMAASAWVAVPSPSGWRRSCSLVWRCNPRGRWYPAIPIGDNGFSAVLLDRLIPYEEACRLFGFGIAQGKPSIPKRIKRHFARGKTACSAS